MIYPTSMQNQNENFHFIMGYTKIKKSHIFRDLKFDILGSTLQILIGIFDN
jgi:hypothetical protein